MTDHVPDDGKVVMAGDIASVQAAVAAGTAPNRARIQPATAAAAIVLATTRIIAGHERAIEPRIGGVNDWAISIPMAAWAATNAGRGTRSSTRPVTAAAIATISGAISHGAGTPSRRNRRAPAAPAAISAHHATASRTFTPGRTPTAATGLRLSY